jgi:hypothetical protein
MISGKVIYKLLNFIIALVWIVNGLVCKVLNLVPRHQQIVARILGEEYSSSITIAIGFAEIAMAIWILSGIARKVNTLAQIAIIGVMNILEFLLVPDLLLWGRYNALFALLFIMLIFYNEFCIKKSAQ